MTRFELIIQNPLKALCFLIPCAIIFAYINLLNKVRFKKSTLVIVSIVTTVIYLFAPFIFVKYYIRPNDSIMDNIYLSLSLEVVFFIGGFYAIEYYIRKALIGDEEKFRQTMQPLNDETNVGVYHKIKTAKIISFISRYTIISFVTLGIIYVLVGVVLEELGYKFNFDNAIYLIAFLAFIFSFNVAFLRCIVRCQSCNLEIFFIDRMLHSHFEVAKRALKDNILECWHCHAAYALDANIDLEILRNENIKNWQEREDKQNKPIKSNDKRT